VFDPAVISGVVSHPAAASVKQSSALIEESSDEKTSDDSSGTARVSEIQASFVAPVLDPGSESSPTISSDGTEISDIVEHPSRNNVIENDFDHGKSTNEDVSLLLVNRGTAKSRQLKDARKSVLVLKSIPDITSSHEK
jgi:hypothetical protein